MLTGCVLSQSIWTSTIHFSYFGVHFEAKLQRCIQNLVRQTNKYLTLNIYTQKMNEQRTETTPISSKEQKSIAIFRMLSLKLLASSRRATYDTL